MADVNEIISKEAIEGLRKANQYFIDIDGNIRKSIDELKAFNTSFRGVAATQESIVSGQTKMQNQSAKLTQIQKDEAKAIKATESASARLNKETIAGKQALDAKVRATKLEVQATNNQLSAYEKLAAKVAIARKNYKDLAASLGEGNKAAIAAQKEFAKLNDKMVSINRKAGQDQDAVGKYGRVWEGVGAKMVAAFSVTAILAFGRAAYQAFEEQEIANRKLLFSLQGNKVAYTELTKQAGDMQKKLGIPDEVINGIQIMAAETGKSVPQIKKLTQAAAELSVLTGEDLQSSYMKLNATLSGSAGRLTRIDSEFGTLTKDQLAHGAAIDLVISKYGGLAEKAVTPTKLLATSWGEFLESVGSGGTILDKPIKFLANFIDLMGQGLKTVKQIKNEVANENLANQSNNASTEISSISSFYQKNGMGKQQADEKAYNTYLETQQNTINARQKENLQLMTEYKTSSFEVQKQKIAQIKLNNEYIKNINDELGAVKKSNETNKSEIVTKPIEKQIGAYAKLTQSIADAKEKINDMLTLGQTPSNELLKKLSDDEQKLIDIGKAAEFAAQKLIAMKMGDVALMQSKGAASIPVKGMKVKYNEDGSIKDDNNPLKKRDNLVTSNAVVPMTTAEKVDFAVSEAQTVADATFQIMANASGAELEMKLSNLDKEKEAALSNSKLTEEQKAKITADYEKKSRKLRTDDAKKQKAAAIVQAIINTALAVTAAMTKIPFSAGAAIAAGIAGAAQIAVISAQKIPQFDAGSQSTPGTFIAGERRPEFMVTPSGQVQLVTRPTLFKNMAGATVIGGEETAEIMRATNNGTKQESLAPYINRMEQNIVNAITNKRELHISASGSHITERQGEYYKTYFNRKISWVGKRN